MEKLTNTQKNPVNSKDIDITEMALIIGRLRGIIIAYDSIVSETKSKIEAMVNFEDPKHFPVTFPVRDDSTAFGEINSLLDSLDRLNRSADFNLINLKKIV